jgi:5'-phosphate synthase pdxT subunit
VKIGVVAIQGDFERHQQVLKKLQVEPISIRNAAQLKQCDALILPGGESTTILKLFRAFGLDSAIKKFSRKKPVMGTCAGLIILAKTVNNPPMETLQLLDLEVTRNAYGRQVDSFIDDVKIMIDDNNPDFEGIFIRAPKIDKVGEGIKPIGYLGNEVVMAENKLFLVATFHPELSSDTRIHKYFVKKVKNLSI